MMPQGKHSINGSCVGNTIFIIFIIVINKNVLEVASKVIFIFAIRQLILLFNLFHGSLHSSILIYSSEKNKNELTFLFSLF